MISLKDYAREKGVSYEAVRKQVTRYKDELEGHITKENRTQYLDDAAVEFLNHKRATNSVILMEASRDDEVKRLSEENKALLLKVAELQDSLLKDKDEVKLLQEQKILLLEGNQARPWWRFWG